MSSFASRSMAGASSWKRDADSTAFTRSSKVGGTSALHGRGWERIAQDRVQYSLGADSTTTLTASAQTPQVCSTPALYRCLIGEKARQHKAKLLLVTLHISHGCCDTVRSAARWWGDAIGLSACDQGCVHTPHLAALRLPQSAERTFAFPSQLRGLESGSGSLEVRGRRGDQMLCSPEGDGYAV